MYDPTIIVENVELSSVPSDPHENESQLVHRIKRNLGTSVTMKFAHDFALNAELFVSRLSNLSRRARKSRLRPCLCLWRQLRSEAQLKRETSDVFRPLSTWTRISSFVMNPRINPSRIAYLSQPLQPHYATLRALSLIFLPVLPPSRSHSFPERFPCRFL